MGLLASNKGGRCVQPGDGSGGGRERHPPSTEMAMEVVQGQQHHRGHVDLCRAGRGGIRLGNHCDGHMGSQWSSKQGMARWPRTVGRILSGWSLLLGGKCVRTGERDGTRKGRLARGGGRGKSRHPGKRRQGAGNGRHQPKVGERGCLAQPSERHTSAVVASRREHRRRVAGEAQHSAKRLDEARGKPRQGDHLHEDRRGLAG